MEELRVANLRGGALAAISGAVVASFFGVFGTLAGAGVMSIFMALATAGYAHSLATAHRWLRRTLRRTAGGETDAGTPPAQPFALAAGRAGGGRVRGRDGRGHHGGGGRQAAASQPARQPTTTQGDHLGRGGCGAVGCANTPAPGTSATSPSASAPTTTAPAEGVTTTAPAGAVPTTTTPSATTSATTPRTPRLRPRSGADLAQLDGRRCCACWSHVNTWSVRVLAAWAHNKMR